MPVRTASALVLALLASGPSTGGVVPAKLAVGELRFRAEAEQAAAEPRVRVSVPIPYRGQTPLAISVTSDPPGRVIALSVEEQGDDRLLCVALAPMEAGERVALLARTYCLLRAERPPNARRVRLARRDQVPTAIRPYLEPAPGVDAADPRIVAIAESFTKKDLQGLVDDVLGWLEANVEGGSGVQGSLDVLERGTAACTGFANLGAALFVAAGVPARILPCILVGVDQQEHYIVEVWTPELGWSKVETTTKNFPLSDGLHLVLRIAGPEAPRSPGSVPLFHPEGEGGATADFDPDEARRCFQAASVLETVELGEDEIEAVETAARKAHAALARASAEGPRVLLLPSVLPQAVKTRGKKLTERVRELVEAPR